MEQLKKLVVHTRRPRREEVIGNQEVIDLKIMLETTKSVEEFLEKVRFNCQM